MENKNPLDGLKIGSTAFGATGKWGLSVVNGAVTRTTVVPTKWMSMHGESSCVYSKQMK